MSLVGSHRCPSELATEGIGEQLAAELLPGDLLCLQGDLAAGKTTFVRGLIRGLGGDADEVSSPTFVIVQSYPCPGPLIGMLHHVDLYRLDGSAATLRETGLEELLSDPGSVVAVEWPKPMITTWLPGSSRTWSIRISAGSEQELRRIEIQLEPRSADL